MNLKFLFAIFLTTFLLGCQNNPLNDDDSTNSLTKTIKSKEQTSINVAENSLNSAVAIASNTNDTTEMIKFVLNYALNEKHIPDRLFLYKNNIVGDTIIFQFDRRLTKYFPKTFNHKFKMLSRDEICELATNQNDYSSNNYFHFQNFLFIPDFVKTDSSYELSIQNTCVIPMKDKNGKPWRTQFPEIDTMKCRFGFLCGGGFSVRGMKINDTLNIKIVNSWND